MKSAVLTGKERMELIDCRRPVPLPNEVLIQIRSCGICGTDQHIYHGQPGSAEVRHPIILGHELAGEVVEIGADVKNFKTGDRVSVDPNIYCGNCHYCRTNRSHLCSSLQAVGVTRDGGMAEFCTVPEENCYKIPHSMTFEEASLVEPLGCVLHGFKKFHFTPLSRVLIIGGGFIGQLFLQLAKHQNVKSIAVCEPVENKKEQLHQLGADEVLAPDELHGREAEIVIECVGRPESMEMAIRTGAKGGQVLLFGVAAPDTRIPVSPFEIFSKELTILGSFINPYTQEEAIALIAQKAIRVEELISHRFPLDELPGAMADYPSLNVSKAVIVP